MKTPDAAHQMACPLARTFKTIHPDGGCQGPSCALWRWIELPSSLLTPHVQKRMAEQGDKSHAKAVAWVMENREALGIPTKPTHGRCGAGGPV